jgi:hypothetical protein
VVAAVKGGERLLVERILGVDQVGGVVDALPFPGVLIESAACVRQRLQSPVAGLASLADIAIAGC